MKRTLIIISDNIEVYHGEHLAKQINNPSFSNLLKIVRKHVRDNEVEKHLQNEFNKFILEGCETFFDLIDNITVHFKVC